MIVECPQCALKYDISGRPPGSKGACRCGHVFTLPTQSGEAFSLSCPGCGEPSDPTDSRCSSCDRTLALARCPRCFASLFAGRRHCGICGADAREPAVRHIVDGLERRPCPVCQTKDLVAMLAGEVLADQCEGCGGLWLDQNVFDRVQKAEISQAPPILDIRKLRDQGPTAQIRPGYIPCPDCEKLMNKRNFSTNSGILIDVCRAHGVWFDAGELGAVVQFIRDGGVARSQARRDDDLRHTERMARIAAQAPKPAMADPREIRDQREDAMALLRGLLGF